MPSVGSWIEWGPANNVRTLHALASLLLCGSTTCKESRATGFQHLLLAVLTNQFNSGTLGLESILRGSMIDEWVLKKFLL